MKRLLLSAALAALATGAHAKCTPLSAIGNLQPFQCDSDNQATDADDVKLFIDKVTGTGNVDGSLVKNASALNFQNIHIFANAGATFNQEGSGFAELHSTDAGLFTNTLRTVTFDPINGSTLFQHSGDILFPGFDGFFGRGQVDATGGTVAHPSWDGDVFMDITFIGGATQTLEFLGDTQHDDVGAIGFDEIADPGLKVDSVTMRLDSTGAWNEVKQFDFSVPGASAVVPEASTWVMMLLGFAFLGFAGQRFRARLAHY